MKKLHRKFQQSLFHIPSAVSHQDSCLSADGTFTNLRYKSCVYRKSSIDMSGWCLLIVSLLRHVTVSCFFRLKQSVIISHTKPASEYFSLLLRRRAVPFPAIMAFVSLFSCPPNPVHDKNLTGSELTGDERSSNVLICFYADFYLCTLF